MKKVLNLKQHICIKKLLLVEKVLNIQEGSKCFAQSSTGKIKFKPGDKLSVEEKQVFIPTFQ